MTYPTALHMTIAEAAEAWGVSAEEIRKWRDLYGLRCIPRPVKQTQAALWPVAALMAVELAECLRRRWLIDRRLCAAIGTSIYRAGADRVKPVRVDDVEMLATLEVYPDRLMAAVRQRFPALAKTP